MDIPDHIREKLVEKTDLGSLATFVPNRQESIYNWFYYKEGYARTLVMMLLQQFQLPKEATVLDPFCGSGTTLLACKEQGINAIGLDVLPVCVFAARVKTAAYDDRELYEAAKKFLKTKYQPIHPNTTDLIRRAFNPHILEDILLFRSSADQIENPVVREFLVLALIRTAMKVTYAFKDGGVIKIRKKHVPSFRQILRRTIFGMIRDVRSRQLKDAVTQVAQRDARYTELEENSVDAVITSPPYLNNIDYTKVYAIEEYLIGEKQLPTLRSYLGLKPAETNTTPFDIPFAAVSYISDMEEFLKEMHRVTKSGAPVAIIIGNGYVERQIVESDLLIATLAETIGFSVESILVLNNRFALEQRTMKKGVLRESLVVLRKK